MPVYVAQYCFIYFVLWKQQLQKKPYKDQFNRFIKIFWSADTKNITAYVCISLIITQVGTYKVNVRDKLNCYAKLP